MCEKVCRKLNVLSQISLSYLDQILAEVQIQDHPVTRQYLKLTTLKNKMKESNRLLLKMIMI